MTGEAGAGPATDFDFLHGSWDVWHRKLRHRLAGDDSWMEFGGTMTARPILAGAGNIDENLLRDPDGTYEACTVRTFDPVSRRWSIFWIDSRRMTPDPPVTGSFVNGKGKFTGEDTFNGKPILVRFLWSRIGQPAPRWEQAFSPDGGVTWETNWIMDFNPTARTGRGGLHAQG